MKRIRFLFGVLLAATLFAQHTSTFNLGTLSAVATSNPVNVGLVAHKHTLQVTVAGSPSTCTVELDGTLDDVVLTASPNWQNLSGSQTCTSSTAFSVVDRPVTGIRGNLTALSGGSSPTVTLKYVGVQ